MVIEEELVRRWQRGWSAARGLAAADEVEGGLRIRCEQPSREVEVLALHADQDPGSVAGLAEDVAADPLYSWLTVPTHHPDRVAATVEAAGLQVLLRSESLMLSDLAQHPSCPLAAPYRSELRQDGPVLTVTLHHPDSSEPAARGTVAVVGADAIADRIETVPAHRRRGLGRALMSLLVEAARTAGAETGLLIASTEGRQLYTSLGWQHYADVVVSHAPEKRPGGVREG
ncbi:GNAT family N-acetyltransferase [Streptacidiphilus sp. N1-12]|uniref:GNAT family N-acetyltransferase n=2 Tax=Streptacidiphilus alkalitolerans TaxID=3342712 RepID=A0ABV6W7K6_9ACTN